MKWIALICLPAFIVLQYHLWFGDKGLLAVRGLNHKIQQVVASNQSLADKNKMLADEIHDLKTSHYQVEAIARHDLGMIKPGERFYRFSAQSAQKK